MRRSYTSQRRIAATILKCGEKRIWMKPDSREKISSAITRKDIRGLINDGLIKKVPAKKKTKSIVKKRQGPGSRKGSAGARMGKKNEWLKIIRPQRRLLKEMKEKIPKEQYRKLYYMIKGNSFRSKAHLTLYLRKKGILEEEKK